MLTMKLYLLKKENLSLSIGMLFITFLATILTGSMFLLIVNLILALITIPIIMRKERKTAKVYFVIFCISILFMFIVYGGNSLYYSSPYFNGGSDDLNFEKQAEIMSNANIYSPSKILKSGLIGQFHNSPFFVTYISIIVKLSSFFGGYSTFIPRFLNIYFLIWSTLIIEYLLKIHSKMSMEKIRSSLALFALTPNIQYINAHVFRDTMNLFQILAIMYLYDNVLNNRKWLTKFIDIIIIFVLIYSIFYTRESALIFTAAGCLFITFEKMKIKQKYALIPFLLLFVGVNSYLSISISRFVTTYTDYLVELSSGFSRIVFSQPLLPFGVIIRAFYAFVSPFPNIFGLFQSDRKIILDLITILSSLGLIIQITLFPFIIKRIRKIDFLTVLFLTFFIGVITTTFTFRHIILYYPFLIAIGVDEFKSKTKTKNLLIFSTFFISIFLGIIYVILKVF